MERLISNSEFSNLAGRVDESKITHILDRPKGVSFIVEIGKAGAVGYFKPERTNTLTVDTRIPSPQELYRDLAYHNIDEMLGWGISAPVIPWEDTTFGRGTLRPFYCDAHTPEDYQVKSLISKFKYFGLKAASLDYATAVIDRVGNDILITGSDPLLIDSGLSFVEGLNPVIQESLFRKLLKGTDLPNDLIDDLKRLNTEGIYHVNEGLISFSAAEWVYNRISRLIEERKIL